jgi:hypothetical protein
MFLRKRRNFGKAWIPALVVRLSNIDINGNRLVMLGNSVARPEFKARHTYSANRIILYTQHYTQHNNINSPAKFLISSFIPQLGYQSPILGLHNWHIRFTAAAEITTSERDVRIIGLLFSFIRMQGVFAHPCY